MIEKKKARKTEATMAGKDKEREREKTKEGEKKRNVERDRSLNAARRLIHKQGHPWGEKEVRPCGIRRDANVCVYAHAGTGETPTRLNAGKPDIDGSVMPDGDESIAGRRAAE